jgi:hypothetical protein
MWGSTHLSQFAEENGLILTLPETPVIALQRRRATQVQTAFNIGTRAEISPLARKAHSKANCVLCVATGAYGRDPVVAAGWQRAASSVKASSVFFSLGAGPIMAS